MSACPVRRWPFRAHRFEAAHDKGPPRFQLSIDKCSSLEGLQTLTDANREITYRGHVCRFCGATANKPEGTTP